MNFGVVKKMIEQEDNGTINLVCPYCDMELSQVDTLTWYFDWVNCPYCKRNFQAKVKVIYYVKNR